MNNNFWNIALHFNESLEEGVVFFISTSDYNCIMNQRKKENVRKKN